MNTHELEVYYDGDCPLCRREIRWLQKRDPQQRVLFTDLASPSFSEQAAGKSYAELMGRIHGKRAEGSWLEGIDLFAELYCLCGLPRLAGLMKNRLLAPFLRFSYRGFARYRLLLTGRRSCDAACRPNWKST
jgi:predicted DCC family thiol-disulfide oxidoreductase YuxK